MKVRSQMTSDFFEVAAKPLSRLPLATLGYDVPQGGEANTSRNKYCLGNSPKSSTDQPPSHHPERPLFGSEDEGWKVAK
ncbi:MAG: hypothetical protein L0287_20215, partial [Anaerolineae bacterium]|nr:hypothetical protein [Anaerolineae bacterium]